MDTHFGDEAVWNVPVTMTWSALNESLVKKQLGGFDAYSVERRAGRPVSKPRWADKLIGTTEEWARWRSVATLLCQSWRRW